MALQPTTGLSSLTASDRQADTIESSRSAVSWAAIFAGAATACAISILLATLGSGLGFASVSPFRNAGASATSFAIGTGIFLIVVQWLSSGLGGYITGRLRTKWSGIRNDEAFFRDTAHGFLSWAVATILTAVLVASAASSLVSGGAQAVAGITSGAAQGATQAAAQSGGVSDPSAYLIDGLFRSDRVDPAASASDAKAEATRILVTSVQNGSIAPADRTYLAQLAAARTGISQQDAEKRVDDLSAKAKAAEEKTRAAAEEARKASTKLSFYLFFSMLIGAFVASVGAAIGGKERDL